MLQTTLEEHTGYVLDCAFSPDCKRVVTASADGTARVWDAEMGALQTTLEGHTGRVTSYTFSPNGAQRQRYAPA